MSFLVPRVTSRDRTADLVRLVCPGDRRHAVHELEVPRLRLTRTLDRYATTTTVTRTAPRVRLGRHRPTIPAALEALAGGDLPFATGHRALGRDVEERDVDWHRAAQRHAELRDPSGFRLHLHLVIAPPHTPVAWAGVRVYWPGRDDALRVYAVAGHDPLLAVERAVDVALDDAPAVDPDTVAGGPDDHPGLAALLRAAILRAAR